MNSHTSTRPHAPPPVVLGTRGSQLALWQARHVQALLRERGRAAQIQTITTLGDREQRLPVSEMGDEGIFTKEIDRALLDGRIDLAVHSLKDLPSNLPEGTCLAAVSARAEPLDAFVAHPSFGGALADLPEGAVVATSSLRRRAMLKAWRADLRIAPVRGNVDTRLEKLAAADWHGMVLAVAGLVRMDRADRIREVIDPALMLPAVGQGALGITCRSGDEEAASLARAAVHDEAAGVAARAERAFLRRIGAGCQVPVGAWARMTGENALVIDGAIAALDGTRVLRERRTCAPPDAERAGAELAATLLEQGGDAILKDVRAAR